MALHFRKFLSSNPDADHLHPCHTNSDSDDCVNPHPHTVPHHRIPTPLLALLCTLGLALLMLSYFAVIRYRNTRRRGLRPRQQLVETTTPAAESVHEETPEAEVVEGEEEAEAEDVVVTEDEDQGLLGDHHVWYIRTVGFPQSVINSIAVFTYKRGAGLIEGTDCSVCLNEFEEDDTLRLLPKCSHAFHLPCIDTWLRAHKNCPLCRAPIMALDNMGNSNYGNTDDSTNQPANEFELGQETRVEGSQEIITDAIVTSPTMPLQESARKTRSTSNSSNGGGIRVLSDLADNRVKINRELPRVRRSSSMDLLSSASIVSDEIGNKEGCLDKRESKNSRIYRLIKSASFGRSLQKGPISMKRSFSFGGKRKKLNEEEEPQQQKSKIPS